MSLLTVIASNSTAIYAVCIPGLLLSAGYVGWRTVLGGGSDGDSRPAMPPPAARATPRRPMAPPMPSVKPRSLEAGMAEHQVRGEAKTVKVPGPAAPLPPVRDERKVDTARMPVVDPSEDEAKDSLFAGLGEKDEPEVENTTIRKAERMEELGFHKQAQSQPTGPLPGEDSGDQRKTELLKPAAAPSPISDSKRAPTRTGDELAAPAAPAAPANRTQTQELDDILSRIDKVLAENPVMATMTLGSNSADQGTPVKPVPPKPPVPPAPADKKPDDKKTDDGSGAQQKLF